MSPRAKPSRLRLAWCLLAWVSLGLALIGVVLPGVPTVPFVLLSAYAAARGSERLHARLLADPRLGPMIRDWQSSGAVSRRAKYLATATMAMSSVSLAVFAPAWIAAIATGCMACVAIWLWRRPEPPQDRDFS